MRIAIDARELVGQPTGVGRYLAEVLAAWGELPEAEAHEFVLCSPEPVMPARPGRLHLSQRIAPGAGTMWEQLTLPRLVAAAGADVLFSPAYTCPLRRTVPIVLMVHDVSYVAHPEWFSRREGFRRRAVTWLSVRRAARVLTQSEFSRQEIAQHLRLDPARIEVIPLGVSRLHQPATREPLVLYVGSLFNRRHISELIAGFVILAARVPEAQLEIVGDNRTQPTIDFNALIDSTGEAAARIRWGSYVTEQHLARLYGTASAFVFLSDYEGFGLTPLEAMAAGIPIVVLDTAISREIYGEAAIRLATPEPTLIAAALERLLTDSAERARLLAAGRARVERYSWHECGRRTLQALVESA